MPLKLLLIISVTAMVCKNSGRTLTSTAGTMLEPLTNMSQVTQRAVQVVRHLAQGPTRGNCLEIHLDPKLPSVTKDAILLTLSSAFPSHSFPVLHLVFFLSSPKYFIDSWNPLSPPPNHILLVNLGSVNDADYYFSHPLMAKVKTLALLTPMPADHNTLAVYTVFPFCSPSLQLLGFVNPSTSLTWDELFPDRFPSNCQAHFRIASWLDDVPNFYYHEIHNRISGVGYSMLQVLAAKLNFSYSLTEKPVDDKWGALENGVWVGLLGMVDRGEYDFSITGFINTMERSESFGLSEPILYESIIVFLRLPPPLSQWLSLVRPFTLKLWGALLVTLCMVYCYLLAQSRVRNTGRIGFMFLVRTVLVQSVPGLLLRHPVVVLWLLVCLVVTSAYTSNLVGIFTKSAFPQRITSFSHLANTNLRLTYPDYTGVITSFVTQTESAVIRDLQERIDVYPEAQAVEVLKTGSHGLVGYLTYTTLILTNKYKISSWYNMKEALVTVPQSWAFKKHWPYKEKFDTNIKRLAEAGLVMYWYKAPVEGRLRCLLQLASLPNHITTSKWCPSYDGVSNKGIEDLLQKELDSLIITEVVEDGPAAGGPLTVHHLQGLFWVMVMAWGVSTAVLFIEIITNRL